MRSRNEQGSKTVRSLSRSFCEDDSSDVYGAMAQIMDADSYRTGSGSAADNLAYARRKTLAGRTLVALHEEDRSGS
jgi:hypothetical protein